MTGKINSTAEEVSAIEVADPLLDDFIFFNMEDCDSCGYSLPSGDCGLPVRLNCPLDDMQTRPFRYD
jgi:hypothetical protein